MTMTTLDPKTALIVVDLQQGILGLPAVHPIQEVVERAGELTAAFRSHSLPVVLVTVAGGAPGRTEQPRRSGEPPAGYADLLPQLQQRGADLTVTKRTWGAFTGTELEQQLRELGVTQVVLAGVAISIGVESTARQAYELGFNVTVVVDAVTDTNSDAHHNSITRIFPRLGETGTTEEILARLGGGGG